jgi:hypothetical protein
LVPHAEGNRGLPRSQVNITKFLKKAYLVKLLTSFHTMLNGIDPKYVWHHGNNPVATEKVEEFHRA